MLQVCSTWHRVAKDTSLWCYLNLKPYAHLYRTREDLHIDILQTYFIPRGTKLSISGYRVNHELFGLIFYNCHQLHTLDVSKCKVLLDDKMADDNYHCLKSLRRFDMRGAYCFSKRLAALVEKMENLECLGKLLRIIISLIRSVIVLCSLRWPCCRIICICT